MSQGKIPVVCECGNDTFSIADIMYGDNITDPGTTARTTFCTKCKRILMKTDL